MANGLVGNVDVSFDQDILNISITQSGSIVEPDSVLDK